MRVFLPPWRWLWLLLGGAPLFAFVLLHVHALFVPLPAGLEQDPPFGSRILDRDGRLLARTMAKDGVFRAPFDPKRAGPYLIEALVAAEDQRFYLHGGIDLLAISRAAAQAITQGRLVSGASTLTQQLARQTFSRPRSLAGKWTEMALALRIERELHKRRILEEYLNRVPFGSNIVGAVAAADHFFGKPIDALSLSEAATLVGLVRGPSLFDPRRRPDLAATQRDRVLDRMIEVGSVSPASAELARSLPVRLLPSPPLPGAHHWVRKWSGGNEPAEITSTLHGPLQRQVETLVQERSRQLADRSAREAAVVILDNSSGDVLAWVGSPQFFEASRGGQNDGITALRQPGSTLKPFLYAFAMEELGLNTASVLKDEPLYVRTADSFYAPRNFDRTFRGSVSLERALSNSLNVPAVQVVQKLGVPRTLTRLRELGLESLSGDPEYYGPALALGDGEVTLIQLTAAYASLARGGMTVAPRFAMTDPPGLSRRVLRPEVCALIAEVLSSDAARRESFGADNPLDLPFPVAVKTGTSKGYRDGWAIGFTKNITVGVWVGNFDGAPTERVTGARGAGPLFHRVALAAAEVLGPRVTSPGATRPLHDVDLRRTAVPRGGRQRLFWVDEAEPVGTTAHVKAENASTIVEQAKSPGDGRSDDVRLDFPKDGMVFRFDPATPVERQSLLLRASGGGGDGATRIRVNETQSPGQPELLFAENGRAEWAVRRGSFEVVVTSRDPSGREETSQAVSFIVR